MIYIKNYTDEELLKPFKAFYIKNGRSVKSKEIKIENDFIFSYATYLTRFSSLKNISVLCNYELTTANQIWNRSKIIDKLKKESLTEISSSILNSLGSGYPSTATIFRYFDTYEELANELNINKVSKKYTKEKIIKEYTLMANKLQRVPKIEEVEKYSKDNNTASVPTIYRNFSCWSQFSLDLGFNYEINHTQKTWSKELIIDKFSKLKDKDNLTMKYVNNLSNEYCSSTTIYEYFDTWNDFLLSIEASPNQKQHFWSKSAIIDTIKPHILNNRLLTARQLEKLSSKNIDFPSVKTIYNVFKSLSTLSDAMNVEYVGNNYSRSAGEIELYSFIKSFYKGNIIIGDRSVIYNENSKTQKYQELDILLPDINIAFEYNGNYFHSESKKDKNYHINKLNKCKEKGISLCYIWESEWLEDNINIKKYITDLVNKQEIKATGEIVIMDNMKPINYINVNNLEITQPEIVDIGGYGCWDCGKTIYEVIN